MAPPLAAAEPERVRLVPDQRSGEVRFVADGQPVLRVTSRSLIVSGSITYTGTVQDMGSGN